MESRSSNASGATWRRLLLPLGTLACVVVPLTAQKGHPAPLAGDASCATCHTSIAENHRRSAHEEARRLTGQPSCSTCHGSPSCQPPRERESRSCADCHPPTDRGTSAADAREIESLLHRARTALAGLSDAAAVGDDHLAGIVASQREHARTLRSRVVELAHRLDVAAVRLAVERLEREVHATRSFLTADLDSGPGFSRTVVTIILGSLTTLGLLASTFLAVRAFRLLRRAAAPRHPPRRRGLLRVVALPLRVLLRVLASPLGLVLLVAGFAGLLFFGSREVYDFWSSPSFCRSCHHMEDYYASWSRSTHNEVRCVECHFEPGLGKELHAKWVALKQLAAAVTGSYSPTPYARVSDASCLRSGCHSREDLAEPVPFSARHVRFRHETHLGEARRGVLLTCTSCHFQSVVTTHMEVHASTCYLCHFTAPADSPAGQCKTCHGAPDDARIAGRFEFAHADVLGRGIQCTECHQEVRSGSGRVDPTRCLSCHNRPRDLRELEDPVAVHLEHVTRNAVHCHSCHDQVGHEFEAARPEQLRDECRACHRSPHALQADFYAGHGARDVADRPNDMHEVGLDCVACHGHAKEGPTADGSPIDPAEACSTCHPPSYSRVARTMIARLDRIQDHLSRRLQRVESSLGQKGSARSPLDEAATRALHDVRDNLGLVRAARPVHNPLYAVDILRSSARELGMLEDRLGLPAPEPGKIPLALRAEPCVVCHPESVEDHAPVHHAPVLTGACTLCHHDHNVGDPQRHTREAWQACTTCHAEIVGAPGPAAHLHDPVGRDCGLCHRPHASDHRKLLRAAPRDLCLQCHERPGARVHGDRGEGCATCHASHASSTPNLLVKPPPELCLGCHDEPQKRADGTMVSAVGKELARAEFRHGAIRYGECTACHDPHGPQGNRRLRRAYTTKVYAQDLSSSGLCLGCHDRAAFTTQRTTTATAFRNGDRNLHQVHVSGRRRRSCQVCHDPHGIGPDMIRRELRYGEWVLPIDFRRTASGGTCSPGCHQTVRYDRERAVPVRIEAHEPALPIGGKERSR